MRRVTIHPLPPGDAPRLSGGVAVVIDLLRASTTICHALAHGAVRVIPVLEIEDAWRVRDSLGAGACVLGGERRGLRIDGFDLGNSPSECTADRVSGKVVIFTTTNGTRAALACAGAARILAGCFANISAVERALVGEDDVHLVCAGTNGIRAREDEIFAGALGARLLDGGFVANDEQTASLIAGWRGISTDRGRVRDALSSSQGGTNLRMIGLAADVEECAREDTCRVVPEMDAAGAFVAGRAY